MFPTNYPKADQRFYFSVKSFQKFQNNTPQGVTIHYTGDRNLNRVVKSLQASGLGYHFIIERDGRIFQLCPLSGAVFHAGRAQWNGLSPNRAHLGISVMSWGDLEKTSKGFESWNGSEISEAKYRDGEWWDSATSAQENSVRVLVEWLLAEGIDPKNICSHSEACKPKGRKIDIGGVLSFPASEFRKL